MNSSNKKSLKSSTLTGLFWTFVSSTGNQLLLFGISIVLAWLLDPEDFGLIGMMLVFTGFASLFNELGLGAALIQAEDIQERHLSSVFYVNLLFGMIMTAVVFFCAPLLAWFYAEPELNRLTKWMSLNFFMGSLVVVHRAHLSRNMNFRHIAVVEILALIVAGTASIAMALFGFGVVSLVAMYLVQTATTVLLFWLSCKWYPKLVWSGDAVKELLGFSGNLLGANTLNYWVRNADNLIIGKFVGTDALGLYTRAYTTMLLPVRQINRVLTRVMFPTMSKIKDEPERVTRLYLKMVQTIALVAFPAMLGLLAVAPDFVLAVYGPKWEGVIPLLQVLCLVGMLQSINSTVGWIYNSQGRTDVYFVWIVVSGILTFIAFGIGIQWGAIGVAIAYAIRVYGTVYWNFSIPGKLIGFNFGDIVSHTAPQFVVSAIMALAVAALATILPAAWPPIARLAVLVPIGAIIYSSWVYLGKPRAYRELMELVNELLAKRRQQKPTPT